MIIRGISRAAIRDQRSPKAASTADAGRLSVRKRRLKRRRLRALGRLDYRSRKARGRPSRYRAMFSSTAPAMRLALGCVRAALRQDMTALGWFQNGLSRGSGVAPIMKGLLPQEFTGSLASIPCPDLPPLDFVVAWN